MKSIKEGWEQIKNAQAKKFHNLAVRCKKALEKEKGIKIGGGKGSKKKGRIRTRRKKTRNNRTKKGGGNKKRSRSRRKK